ncbi:DUF3455 domain-containing protein [Plantactinospora sp. S1510]|uniref:DUF3455 domain-containing protein n=1 Tax=Plantactinospora alkalitolerans TaxID=2789879 RepID=A0ABS0GP71_9ACTN|nr:DUF3455 domain-containing protein [Plantactinospora alkalitolerans]MBF9127906.1 DUF3455 domain-containing protein [Plantactinospora alkalitolerans]
MKWLSGAAGISLVAALLVGNGGVASGTSPREASDRPGPVPAALVPPAGNVPSAVYLARGVQVYQCTGGAWTFAEPAATLTGLGRAGLRTAVHFRGPSWESTRDGSLVEARAVASSPVTGSIPELLLEATRNRGEGDFGAVTYLQRLATSGGAAPPGACADGATTGVPYRAEYRLFVAS